VTMLPPSQPRVSTFPLFNGRPSLARIVAIRLDEVERSIVLVLTLRERGKTSRNGPEGRGDA